MYSERTLEQVKRDMARLEITDAPADLKVYSPSEEARSLSLENVLEQILQYNLDHLVITGGEPLLQQKSLISLLQKLKAGKKTNCFVEVETNGSVRAEEPMLDLVDQWNVSPKLESSGNSPYAREKQECMRSFGALQNSYFKFVIQTRKDLDEIEALLQRHAIKPSKIILMPEGTDAAILRERTIWLSQICEGRGYRLTPRLHILLWGNKRAT